MIERRLEPLRDILGRIAAAEEECRSANVEENDYTVFTREDLEFEYALVTGAVAKKFKFIDNQVKSSLLPSSGQCILLSRDSA